LIHFGEIALKGKNRGDFENLLISNLKQKAPDFKIVKKEYGKLIVEGLDRQVLQTTFGIANFAPIQIIDLDLDLLISAILKLAQSFDKNLTFKVEVKRSNKNFPITSPQLSKKLGEEIIKKYWLKPDLKNPDQRIWVEVGDNNFLVYRELLPWLGGLPVGSSGKGLALLSGGIDSPVASRLMMKRGLKMEFFHAINPSLQDFKKIKQKILSLAKQLAHYQGEVKIYFFPYKDINSLIVQKVPAKLRMVAFKRSIFRLGSKFAQKKHLGAIVPWDSLAQVASQTLQNIATIWQASWLPVLAPLIGMDKKEVIELAKKIWTYDISIQKVPDCCSLIADKHPATKAKLDIIQKIENEIWIEEVENSLLVKNNFEEVVVKS